MKKMKFLYLFLVGGLFFVNGQTTQDLNIDFMLRGHLYAKSSIVDTAGFGGYGVSGVRPRKIKDSNELKNRGLSLLIDTTRIVTTANNYKGYLLHIINKTDTIVVFPASDSRLEAVAEVWYEDRWQPIEYLPRSTCGISYHALFLKPDYCWTFAIPKFNGKIKTKLRYKLDVRFESLTIYSNEIFTSFNLEQLTNKKLYLPNGLMDPYDE